MLQSINMKLYYLYIITNYTNSTLYIGITSNLQRRLYQHITKIDANSFSSKYNIKKLVYYEVFRNVRSAIEREKQLKGWTRKKKNNLITNHNPEWRNLLEQILPKYPSAGLRQNDNNLPVHHPVILRDTSKRGSRRI
jgi:putative endonuclease